nr:MAG TPA: baseplate protein [Caudoviricetes sp.]
MSIIHKGIKLTTDNYIDISQIENLILKNIYRVGDIIMTTNIENPSVKYGGSWVSWGIGKVPVGIDVNQDEFNLVEKTGGEKNHKLTIEEMAKHTHIQDAHWHFITSRMWNNGLNAGSAFTIAQGRKNGSNFYNLTIDGVSNIDPSSDGTQVGALPTRAINQNTGGDVPHNNLQPYITCYFWKKTL